MNGDDRRTRRMVRVVQIAFGIASIAGIALAGVYIAGGFPQIEGVLLAVALTGIGTGLIVWGKHLLIEGHVVEPRHGSDLELRDATLLEEELRESGARITERRSILRMLAAALGALGFAAVFPIRSLGPRPGNALFDSPWHAGLRVVDENGDQVHVDDLEVGSVITVWPEGHVGAADAQTLLIRVEPALLRLPEGREEWTPMGYVAYSKICTHAGCPVGLYRESTHQLLCPCHQSTFNVLEGAIPTFGPAARPLPQLPLTVDERGFLHALGDFSAPAGPSFWDLG